MENSDAYAQANGFKIVLQNVLESLARSSSNVAADANESLGQKNLTALDQVSSATFPAWISSVCL